MKTETLAANPRLQACPDCGREVSMRAAACPHCGGPIAARSPAGGASDAQVREFVRANPPRQPRVGFLRGLIIFVFAMVGVAMVAVMLLLGVGSFAGSGAEKYQHVSGGDVCEVVDRGHYFDDGKWTEGVKLKGADGREYWVRKAGFESNYQKVH